MKTMVSTKINNELKEKIDKIANEKQWTLSHTVAILIKEAFKNDKKKDFLQP